MTQVQVWLFGYAVGLFMGVAAVSLSVVSSRRGRR
jgi:hypothetical protein